MDMMEETEEQTTYSVTLEDLALGNGETNGENGGTGGTTDGESSPPPPPPTQKLKKVSCYCPSPVDKSGSTFKCSDDGKLETCTSTQQGSNGCYKATILRGIILLCENPE